MSEVEDFIEFAVLHRATNLPLEALAEVFDRLIWCLDDNGEELQRVRGNWLRSDDQVKVEIALLMSEVFPFEEREEMVAVWEVITRRWPYLTPLCQGWIVAFDGRFQKSGSLDVGAIGVQDVGSEEETDACGN